MLLGYLGAKMLNVTTTLMWFPTMTKMGWRFVCRANLTPNGHWFISPRLEGAPGYVYTNHEDSVYDALLFR